MYFGRNRNEEVKSLKRKNVCLQRGTPAKYLTIGEMIQKRRRKDDEIKTKEMKKRKKRKK